HDHVVEVAKVAVHTIGEKSRLVTSGGGSDANIISSYGIPTVNLAVGYEYIHTIHERIAISELMKLTKLVIAIVNEVAKWLMWIYDIKGIDSPSTLLIKDDHQWQIVRALSFILI